MAQRPPKFLKDERFERFSQHKSIVDLQQTLEICTLYEDRIKDLSKLLNDERRGRKNHPVSIQARAEKPLGTDCHRTISKRSSKCWLLIGHKKCFVLLCLIGEQHRQISFRVFVHDGYCLAVLYIRRRRHQKRHFFKLNSRFFKLCAFILIRCKCQT